MKTFKGRVVVPGTATLKALVSHEGFNTLASYKNCKEGKEYSSRYSQRDGRESKRNYCSKGG